MTKATEEVQATGKSDNLSHLGMAPDEFEDARVALDAWEKETQAERWTVKRMTAAALFALLWAILVEVRALRWQQGRE